MTLNFKNCSVNYKTTGDGPAVVLLHGFLETMEMWKDFISDLSQNNQVISIDLLGHGRTGCIGYIHTMEDMAEAVLAVLNQLKIKKAKFVGHSMGGYVALALAEKKSLIFEGLCLMNSTFEADDEEKRLLRTRANKMARTDYENLVRLSFANLFAPESKVKYKNAYDDALKVALQTSVQGYIAAQEGMKLRPNRFNVFKNLTGGKQIIIGKKDGLVDRKKLIKKIKDTSIDYSEFSEGHMSHIENKSDLSYFLNLFVEK